MKHRIIGILWLFMAVMSTTLQCLNDLQQHK